MTITDSPITDKIVIILVTIIMFFSLTLHIVFILQMMVVQCGLSAISISTSAKYLNNYSYSRLYSRSISNSKRGSPNDKDFSLLPTSL